MKYVLKVNISPNTRLLDRDIIKDVKDNAEDPWVSEVVKIRAVEGNGHAWVEVDRMGKASDYSALKPIPVEIMERV